MSTATPLAACAMSSAPARSVPLSLFALAVFYGGMTCIAGVLGNKQVALGPLAVEAGIFAFLLLVVVSSAVAELHGRAVANRLVLLGFVPLIASVALTWIVLAIPASPKMEPDRLAAFDLLLTGTPRIWLGGIVAYGISMSLNVWLFDRMRGSGGRFVALRGAVASALSQAVDTLIFLSIAFYGVFPIAPLMGGQMLAKVALSLIAVPFLIQAAVALGRRLDRGA